MPKTVVPNHIKIISLLDHFYNGPSNAIFFQKSYFIETVIVLHLTLLHSEWPKLYTILAFLSAIGLKHEKKQTKNFVSKISLNILFQPYHTENSNRVDPDVTHYELPHPYLCCLQFQLFSF